MKLRDANTGQIHLARVSFFVFDEGKLSAIANVKIECTSEAAKAAHEELENFVRLIGMVKNSEHKDQYTFTDSQGNPIPLEAFSNPNLKLLTIGPKGGKSVGFMEELEVTKETIEKATSLLQKEESPKKKKSGFFRR